MKQIVWCGSYNSRSVEGIGFTRRLHIEKRCGLYEDREVPVIVERLEKRGQKVYVHDIPKDLLLKDKMELAGLENWQWKSFLHEIQITARPEDIGQLIGFRGDKVRVLQIWLGKKVKIVRPIIVEFTNEENDEIKKGKIWIERSPRDCLLVGNKVKERIDLVLGVQKNIDNDANVYFFPPWIKI